MANLERWEVDCCWGVGGQRRVDAERRHEHAVGAGAFVVSVENQSQWHSRCGKNRRRVVAIDDDDRRRRGPGRSRTLGGDRLCRCATGMCRITERNHFGSGFRSGSSTVSTPWIMFMSHANPKSPTVVGENSTVVSVNAGRSADTPKSRKTTREVQSPDSCRSKTNLSGVPTWARMRLGV